MITVEDIEEIRQLKARYCRSIDLKRWEELRTVFADDCEYVGTAMVVPGPDAFVAGVEKALGHLRTVHQVGNAEIKDAGEGRARGSWGMLDFISWDPDDEVPRFHRGSEEQRSSFGFGYYEEEYAKTSDGWKIARMRLSRLLPQVALFDVPPELEESRALDQVWGPPESDWMAGGGFRAP